MTRDNPRMELDALISAVADAVAANVWGATVFAVVFATLVLRYLAKRVFDHLARQLERTHNLYDDAVLDAARKPIGWGIWSFGILFAAQVAGKDSEAEVFGYLDGIRDVLAIMLLAWFAIRLISFVQAHVVDPDYREQPMDQATVTAIAKLLRASVLITALLMALQSLGVPIAGVLAFGGLGGIAVGFAARDLLANFFGALMLLLDRPFAVGDWIRSPDREIEGTVEEIGWRQTIIRTFDQRPLYVPNSVFTTLSVENPTRMHNRRIYEIIGLRYDDMAVLQAVVDEIRELLRTHPAIDPERTLIVNFLSFGPSSLDIMVYTFTKTTDWVEFHGIKEQVMLKMADIVAAHGAEFAFPTSTVHLPPPEPEQDEV
jgi:MscS family membrane protein